MRLRRPRRYLLVFLAVALLAGIGFQSALAVTPNDVQYNNTTTSTTTTSDTTTTNATPTTNTTTSNTTTTAALTPPPQSTPSSGVKGSQAPSTPAPLTTAPSSGTLPFTGLDLGAAFGAGLLLVAAGFALRRLGRKSGQSES